MKRKKEITRHVDEGEVDELLREADDEARLRRIGFVKNLYRGDTIPEAAEREGRSPATGDRWADAWNAGGFDELMPSFGGGRPPKLDDDDRRELLELLREDQPSSSRAIRQLLDEEFGVAYHPDYLGTVLRDIGMTYVESQPSGAEGGAGTADESGDDRGGWVVDKDIRMDGT